MSTALLSDCVERFHAMDCSVRQLSGSHVIGVAFCVQTVAGDNATLHQALSLAPPGCVFVVDAGAATTRAVWGDVLTEAAIARGVAGLVMNGLVRDIAEISRRGWPVFAAGTTPAGPHKAGGGRIGFAIAVGGVVVRPGDIVVGDADGVVVIPSARLQETIEAADTRKELEASWLRQIRGGASTHEMFDLPANAAVHPSLSQVSLGRAQPGGNAS